MPPGLRGSRPGRIEPADNSWCEPQIATGSRRRNARADLDNSRQRSASLDGPRSSRKRTGRSGNLRNERFVECRSKSPTRRTAGFRSRFVSGRFDRFGLQCAQSRSGVRSTVWRPSFRHARSHRETNRRNHDAMASRRSAVFRSNNHYANIRNRGSFDSNATDSCNNCCRPSIHFLRNNCPNSTNRSSPTMATPSCTRDTRYRLARPGRKRRSTDTCTPARMPGRCSTLLDIESPQQ